MGLPDRLAEELEISFPNLVCAGYRVTSPDDGCYNCVAWAVHNSLTWFQPELSWMDDIPISVDLESYEKFFNKGWGFQKCSNGEFELGFEKIVLYKNEIGEFTHVARQLESGAWTSKLGGCEDISHNTPQALECDLYGQAVSFMKRQTDRPISST